MSDIQYKNELYVYEVHKLSLHDTDNIIDNDFLIFL